MKKKLLLIVLSLAVLLFSAACGTVKTETASAEPAADTVVYANVRTTSILGALTDADGAYYVTADAIGIRDGKIVYVGTRDGVQGLIGTGTEILDYSDQYIVPGFIDGHTHAYISGENKICDFNLVECRSVDEYIAVIGEYVKANPKEFYIGYGWLDVYFENGQPTADLLDRIETDSPIYIKSEDCHSCWTNTAMMDKCGITKDTEDPDGGVIEHYESGEPSGCFRDTAMDVLIKPNVPVYSVEDYKTILSLSQQEYLELGYSAYNDVIIDDTSIDHIAEAYHQLDQEGALKAYVNISCVVNNNENTLANIRHIKELADQYAADTHFRVSDVKFFMDGITESCTAAMKEAYRNDPSNYGVNRWADPDSAALLSEATTLCNDLGLVAHFHAIGDDAVSKALDAVEYAAAHSSNTQIRNVMTHIQFITDEDIARFKDLNMIASCDFGWCYTDSPELAGDENYENIEFINLGEERVDQEMRYESMRKAGITVAFATDYPATCNVDPFLCMELGSARMYESMQSTANNQALESMQVSDELAAITINAAEQLQRENEIGSIEAGKQANFLVLDKDLMNIETADIYDGVRIVASYIDGVKVN